MATSTCPKCDSHQFEMKENSPTGSSFKVNFVQCRSCGAVVGVMDYFSVPVMLEKLAAKLGVKL